MKDMGVQESEERARTWRGKEEKRQGKVEGDYGERLWRETVEREAFTVSCQPTGAPKIAFSESHYLLH